MQDQLIEVCRRHHPTLEIRKIDGWAVVNTRIGWFRIGKLTVAQFCALRKP